MGHDRELVGGKNVPHGLTASIALRVERPNAELDPWISGFEGEYLGDRDAPMEWALLRSRHRLATRN